MNRLSLDLNLLAVLDIMLQEEHVGRTARRINLSQPAISGALARLRTHFRDDLFVRRGSRMIPTAFALELAPIIREFDVLARTIANARPAFDATTMPKTFTILASDYVASTFLRTILEGLPETAQGVTFAIEPLMVESHPRFAAGQADFLISPKVYKLPHIVFSEDRLVAIIAGKRAGKTSNRSLSRKAWRDTTQIAPLIGRDIARRISGLGEGGPVIARAPFALIGSMVSRSSSLAVVPEMFARLQARHLSLRILDLPESVPPLVEYLYWRREDESDPASQWMRKHLMKLRGKQASLTRVSEH